MSNRVIEYDKDYVLTVQQDHGSKEFTKQDGVTGSIQTVTVTLESGNVTILKLWSKENFPFLPGYRIKINHCNVVEEKWGEKVFANIHTTFDSQIEYPYTKDESIKMNPLVVPVVKEIDAEILTTRLNKLDESLRDLHFKINLLCGMIVLPVNKRKLPDIFDEK